MSYNSNMAETTDTSFPPNAIALPFLALLTMILDTTPLIWHVRNRNIAAASLVFWIMLSNMMNLVNSLIWPTDNFSEWWPGWILCDIEVKLMVAEYVAVITCLLCIMRNLAKVLDTERTVLSLSKTERRRRVVIECLLCWGAPIYMMAIHYVVQPSRYYIFAISGCTPSFNDSWPKIVLVFMWPPIVCLVCVYYSVLVIVRMYRYRRDFSQVLASADSRMTRHRFMRLFLMSIVLIALVFPVECFVLYKNLSVPFGPYVWDRIHDKEAWRHISFIPTYGAVSIDRWIQIGMGFGIFLFFGTGPDAVSLYRHFLLKLGLGKIFRSLNHEPSERQSSSATGSHASSVGSRARLVFAKTFKKASYFSRRSNGSRSSVGGISQLPLDRFSKSPTISVRDRRISGSMIASSPTLSKSSRLVSPNLQQRSWLEKFSTRSNIFSRIKKQSADIEHAANPSEIGFNDHIISKEEAGRAQLET